MRRQADTPPAGSIHSDLSALADTQFGVVTRAQLTGLGLGPGAIDERLRTRKLFSIHRGVYAVGHQALRWEGRWLAAVLACGPGAVISHRSAARLWGIRPPGEGRIEVTIPGTGLRTVTGVLVHRTRRLPPDGVTVRSGLPLTTVTRTLVDLADVIPNPALQQALEQAEVQRLLDMRALTATIEESPGRRGARRLRTALASLSPDPRITRSELEDAFLDLCRRHELPRPAVNHRVLDFEVDFYWPARKLIVETDGYDHHGTRSAFEADRWRDLRLRAAGCEVVRCTWRQVTTKPAEVAELLKAVLANERRASSG